MNVTYLNLTVTPSYSSLQDRRFTQMLTCRSLGISVTFLSLLKVLEGLSSPSVSRDCASHPHTSCCEC